jgi:hypothetical protein
VVEIVSRKKSGPKKDEIREQRLHNLHILHITVRVHAVALLVEALCYKPEGRESR